MRSGGSDRGIQLLHPRSGLALRIVVRIRRRGDESRDQFEGVAACFPGERADSIELPGEPGLLFVEVIELRVAPRNRRGIVPDLRGERAPAVFEVERDFIPHRRELGRVPLDVRFDHSGLMPAAFTTGHHFSISALGNAARASGVCCSRRGLSWPSPARPPPPPLLPTAPTVAPLPRATRT